MLEYAIASVKSLYNKYIICIYQQIKYAKCYGSYSSTDTILVVIIGRLFFFVYTLLAINKT